MGWCILALATQFGGGWRSDQEWGLPRKSYIGPAPSLGQHEQGALAIELRQHGRIVST